MTRLTRLLVATVIAVLLTLVASSAHASAEWWQRVGFAGDAVTALRAGGGTIEAEVGGVRQVSRLGEPWQVEAGSLAPPESAVRAGADEWSIVRGRVLRRAGTTGVTTLDPHSPDLGPGARLIATPVANPGTVIAVSENGVVWRRKDTGDWSVSLLLLPSGLLRGTPDVTAVTAFNDHAVSGVVYIGTRGYGTLLTSDGGDDWTRADPGLPGNVNALASDGSIDPPAVYAATDDGLWVHRLRALPSIPVYARDDLLGRGLLTAVVVLLASCVAAALLLRFARSDSR